MALTLLDPIGASFSLLATYYFTQAKSRAFPISLLAIIINSILYYQKGIYAHVALEGAYLLSSLYGWYYWSAGQTKIDSTPAVSHIPILYLLLLVLFSLIMIPILAYGLGLWTDSTIPYWDATTTLLALLAQWMLCRKWIESWALWFIVDALVVILHLVKGIPFHSAVHAFYLGMAVMGYLKWRKMMALQKGLTQGPIYAKSYDLADQPLADLSLNKSNAALRQQ